MKYKLDLVSTIRRIEWIKSIYKPSEVIFMGDGIFDHYVMREVGYSISPANADLNAKKYSDFTTTRKGGDRAVAEACLHVLEKFFDSFDPNFLPDKKITLSKEWTVQ